MRGMGRWVSFDPLGMVDSLNIHGYVLGDPANQMDLDGRGVWKRFWCWLWGNCTDKDSEAPIPTQCGNAVGTAVDIGGTAALRQISPKGIPFVIDPLVGAGTIAPGAYNVGKRTANDRDNSRDLATPARRNRNWRVPDPSLEPDLSSDVYGPQKCKTK